MPGLSASSLGRVQSRSVRAGRLGIGSWKRNRFMEEEALSFLLKGGPQMREGLEGFLNIISGSITECLIREHLT